MFIKLSSWSSSIFLIFLFVSFFVANTYGLSVSYNYHDEGGSISDSQNYNLDASTAMKSTSIFEGSHMEQAILANGKGQNSLGQQITGNSYSFENTVSSSGSFGVSSASGASSTAASTSQSVSGLGETTLGRSVAGEGSLLQNSVTSSGLLSDSGSFSASADGGSMNQMLVGKGNVALAMSGIKGEDNSGQKAIVEAGSMVSAQGISSGKGVSSSQSTAISGEAGGIGSGALSTGNMMLVTGNFVGSGNLNAKLDNGASDHAFAHAKVSVNGGTLIDDSTIQSVGKDGIGLNVEGLTAVPDGGTGSFSATVVNMNQANSKLAGSNNVAAAQAQTGYNLWTVSGVPMKWTTNNPQVQLYLVGSSVPGNLKLEDVQTAISTAANTWGNVVGQNLFADGSTVKIDNTKKVVPVNGGTVGANTQGWRTLSSDENPSGNTLAITYNRFNGPSGGYYSITESDTAFNSARIWSTTGGTYDVQSVSLHELGHTIGLGHISDANQIMNPYYTGSHSLGPGDIAGAQFLYGTASSPTGWSDLGGYITSNPNIIQDSQGRTHVFARGGDGALLDNVNGKWYSLGGYISSDPYAVKDNTGNIYIFARGGDNALLANRLITGNMASSWKSLGGYITSNPTAVYDGQGSVYAFVKGGGNDLWTNRLITGSMASSWKSLGGHITSDPTAVYDGKGNVFSYAKGIDNALWNNRLATGSMASSWKSLSGYITSDPTAVYDGKGSVYAFIKGGNNALYYNSLATGSMASSWKSLGGYITSDPTAVYDGNGNVFSFAKGGNNALLSNGLITGSTTSSWKSLGGYITSNPSALYDDSNGKYEVVVRGSDSALKIKEV